jgi:hypothetical protein
MRVLLRVRALVRQKRGSGMRFTQVVDRKHSNIFFILFY